MYVDCQHWNQSQSYIPSYGALLLAINCNGARKTCSRYKKNLARHHSNQKYSQIINELRVFTASEFSVHEAGICMLSYLQLNFIHHFWCSPHFFILVLQGSQRKLSRMHSKKVAIASYVHSAILCDVISDQSKGTQLVK